MGPPAGGATFTHLRGIGADFRRSRYLGVSVRHQRHRHDVLQHAPGGEELLADEDPAARTQTLVIQGNRNGGHRAVRSGRCQLHALLLYLKTTRLVHQGNI